LTIVQLALRLADHLVAKLAADRLRGMEITT
jgi:hypothetical protein